MTKPKKRRPLKVETFSHCEMLTSEPGMHCPLCRAALQPWVWHACRKIEKGVKK